MKNRTLNLKAVSEYLGIKRRTLYDMIEDGRFPVKPIDHIIPRRWNIEDIDAWRFGNTPRGENE